MRSSSVPAATLPASAVSVALAGLPPGELARLRERLEDEVARRFPLDLGLDPPPDPEGALLGRDLPALTAAANLTAGPWRGGGLEVTLADACPADALRCLPALRPVADEPTARRARALAWAVASGRRVRPPDSAAFAAALTVAREKPGNRVALAFASDRGTLDEAQLAPLRASAAKVLAHLPAAAPERYWVEALAHAQAAWQLPVKLEPGEWLVVPRLSALAREGEFEREIEGALNGPSRSRL